VGIWHLTKKFEFNLDTSKSNHQTLFLYSDTGYLPCGFAYISRHSHHTPFKVFSLAAIVHFGLLSPPCTFPGIQIIRHSASEMITIRFAGWISGRIVSLQPDTDIQKLLSAGNRIRIRISETILSIFLGFRLLEKLRIAQSLIYYLQKHLFSLLCHDFQFFYGVISAP